MSKHELIQAYITGRIGRRDFVRRLSALGVSGAAAAAYVQVLSPSAAASGLSRNAQGYVVRLQTTDPYGEIPIEEILEIIRLLIQLLDRILALLESVLSQASVSPSSGRQYGYRALQSDTLSESDLSQLDTIREQLSLHRDALSTVISDLGGDNSADSTSSSESTPENSDEALTQIADLLNTAVGAYANMIPAIPGSDEQTVSLRQTVTTIALVEARQASFVNSLLGEPSFPDTFEPAVSKDDLTAAVEGA